MIIATKSTKCICHKEKTWGDHPFNCNCGLIPQKFRGKFYLGTMEDWDKFIDKEIKRRESSKRRKRKLVKKDGI